MVRQYGESCCRSESAACHCKFLETYTTRGGRSKHAHMHAPASTERLACPHLCLHIPYPEQGERLAEVVERLHHHRPACGVVHGLNAVRSPPTLRNFNTVLEVVRVREPLFHLRNVNRSIHLASCHGCGASMKNCTIYQLGGTRSPRGPVQHCAHLLHHHMGKEDGETGVSKESVHVTACWPACIQLRQIINGT